MGRRRHETQSEGPGITPRGTDGKFLRQSTRLHLPLHVRVPANTAPTGISLAMAAEASVSCSKRMSK